MLSFEDLLLANLIVRRGLAAPGAVQAALEVLDQSSSRGDLIAQLGSAGPALAQPQAREQAFLMVRRYVFAKQEAAFAARARASQAVPAPALEEVIARQQREGLAWSLGDRLVQEGKLAQAIRVQIDRAVALDLQAEESSTLARHRASRFGETVGAAPLVGAKTRGFAQLSPEEIAEALGAAQAPPVSPPPPPPSSKNQRPKRPSYAPGSGTPPPFAPGSVPQDLGTPTINLAPGSVEKDKAASDDDQRTVMMVHKKDGPLLPGRTVAKKYVVLEELGRGGMGIVYRARARERGGIDVALKVVTLRPPEPGAFGMPASAPAPTDEVVGRFKREILTASLVDDENVCAVYDAGESDGLAFMAMELVEGETLKDVVKREAPLAPDRALELTAQILRGLAACHEAKVIHRDLKPENVRLTKKDGEEIAKLVDFGIARLIDQDPEIAERVFMTVKGKLSGTPVYVAPELIMEPEMVDARCDLYAVGVILYELLTGKLPFASKTLREILKDSIESRPIPLSDAAPGHKVPEAVERFLFKMMEKDPLVRPQTARDALALLDEARGGPRKGKRKAKASAGAAASEKKGCFGLFLF